MESNKPIQPWLDPNGRIYSDDALKEISKTWDSEIWERFLVETVDRPQRESLVLDEEPPVVQVPVPGQTSIEMPRNELHALVRRLIRSLTPRQQQVIRMIYWKGLSERKIADELGLIRGTVAVIKRHSLRKLKRLLERHTSIFPMGRDTNELSPEGETQNENASEGVA